MKKANKEVTRQQSESLYNAKTTKMRISPVDGEQLLTSLRDIMTPQVIAVEKGIPVAFAAQLMRDNDVGILPVVDDGGRVVGCVTDRDLAIRALPPNISNPQELLVKDVMSESAWCASIDNTVDEVVDAMGKYKIRRMPVLDGDNKLVGIVSIGDVAVKADRDEALTVALERISTHQDFWHSHWR